MGEINQTYDDTIKYMAWTNEFQQLYDWDTIQKEFGFTDFVDPDFTWYAYTGYTTHDGNEIYIGHVLIDPTSTVDGVYIIKRKNTSIVAEYNYCLNDIQKGTLNIPINAILKNCSIVGHIAENKELLELNP